MKDILKALSSYNLQKFELINDIVEEGFDVSRGVFVNRTLKMDDIKYIGFDMDYTLAIYNKKEIEETAFNLAIGKLIKEKNYPEIISQIKYDPDYVIRGLVIDQKHGNILKLDRHKYIKRAEHGTTSLSPKQIRNTYPSGKIKQSEDNYSSVDTLFSLPEAYMYARIIDYVDRGSFKIDNYSKLFDDIRDCIDQVHRDGTLKGIISQDLKKYIYKDLRLPLVLDKFREKGKKLFLLTNSEWSYTNTVMNYLLENTLFEYKNWRDYFDIVICHAGKPDFFVKERDFFELNEETGEKVKVIDFFERNKVYAQGNCFKLEYMIEASADEILYIGDHIYGDILRSSKDSGWRTVLVVQELEEELEKFEELYPDIRNLHKIEKKRDKIDYEIAMYANKIKNLEQIKYSPESKLSEDEKMFTDKILRELDRELVLLEDKLQKVVNQINKINNKINSKFHHRWGPIFQEGDEISRFGDQVKVYACIYTSRISNFFFYPVNNYFKSLKDIMPHQKLELYDNY